MYVTISSLCFYYPSTESDRPSFTEITPSKRAKTLSVEPPRQFFLQLLLKHPMSLWEGPPVSGIEISQWERCAEYFQFLSTLVHGLKGQC